MKRFYLACFRDNIGSSVSFQCHDYKGYATNVDKAHVCNLGQAQNFYDTAREFDQPLCADAVDALTVWKVDHQYIPIDTALPDSEELFVAYVKGQWDGNDVYWLNHHACSINTDFMTATKLTKIEAMRLSDKYIAIPYSVANKVKRRTFSFKLFDYKEMVEKAGLVKPPHLKKSNRKKSNPKTRFNCPTCGKLHWQYDPHIFNGCNDIHCESYGVAQ
ncbi:hypothetical protein KTH44_16205 [Acinetobacter bereziniae]|uniref:hypothetical protein n=1 Tax=Acinetobacter bereziniae TaxID=106648 RepID=UPI0021CD6069|nr:hypothetical protein [Acinetobacter bereziniae]MCU4320661.1 hypothetical protein [Acinetobacter bereziniae]